MDIGHGVVLLLLGGLAEMTYTQDCADMPLYLSGPDVGDIMTPDDSRFVAASPLNLALPVAFGNGCEQYSTLYVTDDGTISFGTEYNPIDNMCPLPDPSATAPFVAMYWTDLDPYCNADEAIGYRFSQDADFLEELNELVRCCRDETFNGTIAVIATYTNLPSFDCTEYTGPTTSFQGILISDSSSTYLLTKFVKLDLSATAAIGYQYSGADFYNHPLSCLSNENFFSSEYYQDSLCGGVIISDNLGTVNCGYPGAGDNVISSPPDVCYLADTTVTYNCRDKYIASDGVNSSRTLTCLGTGKWDGDALECEPACFECPVSSDMEECQRTGSYVLCTAGTETQESFVGNGQEGAHLGHLEDNYCADTPKCATQYHDRGNYIQVEMNCLKKDACIHKSYDIKFNEKCEEPKTGVTPKCVEVTNPGS